MSEPNAYVPQTSEISNVKGGQENALAASDDKSPKCRFRFDNDSSKTLILSDGRTLSYAQYGALTGSPILYLHGLPGCRLEGAIFHDVALELGARLIAIDRPGIGKSSPKPGRTLLDYPKDVECLADHLNLEEYSVLGISGGGPYALACAKAMPPNRLKSVSVVCGLGPPDLSMRDTEPMHRYGLRLGYRHFPTLTKWWFKRQALGRLDLTDEERLKMLQKDVSKSKGKVHEKEFAVMNDEDVLRLSLNTARETFSQGFDGFAQDGKVMCVDWGFRIEEIRKDLPVHLWHGKFDNFVPPSHAEQTAERLGKNARLNLVEETHSSISFNTDRQRDFMGALIKGA